MAAKQNRCWPGYEPVKGKKAKSQGSCRPKAESNLAPSEKSFRSKRRKQLDEWQKEHPESRKSAAQHLGPETKPKKARGKSKRQSS